MGQNSSVKLILYRQYANVKLEEITEKGGGWKLLGRLIGADTFLTDVDCRSWEELVDIAGEPLVKKGLVEPSFLQSIKETVHEYGAYMVLVDDVALFHGRPEAGVHQMAMSLALLKEPVYLLDKRIQAAFVLAATDNDSHLELLQELAILLDDEEFLELLCERKDVEKIRKRFEEAENG